uniref:Shq1 C-terminal domain-containing protein n=1 Tax=Haptolina brevifila TaxID=156173 RepID=A0A7S2MZ90_9EUKA
MCGLVDLLFAYAYDVRTTEGESTVESGWTIRRLSCLFSWLEEFDSVVEVSLACVRRSLTYPLVRHLGLACALLRDVEQILRLGAPAVLRSLLMVRGLVQRSDEHGYLLNRIWTDDYCVWLQQLPPRWLDRLADKLAAVHVTHDMLAWPLAAFESLARGEDDEEDEEEDDDDDDDDDDEVKAEASSAVSVGAEVAALPDISMDTAAEADAVMKDASEEGTLV